MRDRTVTSGRRIELVEWEDPTLPTETGCPMIRTAPRRLGAGLTAGLLAATLIAPGVATAAPRTDSVPACLLHPLPLPAGVRLARERMFTDPTGRFIVGTGVRTTDQGRESLLLRWDGPRVTVLTRAPGSLLAVNRQGVLIGEGPSEAGYPPWRFRDGRLEWLPRAPNGLGGYVGAINGRGDIVGFGGYLEYPEPLLWPADRPGTVERLEPTGYPVAILDDGTIVGVAPAEEDRSPGVAGVRRPARLEGVPPPVAWASSRRADRPAHRRRGRHVDGGGGPGETGRSATSAPRRTASSTG